MPYITLSDLEARFGSDEIVKLADNNSDGIPDSEVIAAAIEDTEALIHSRLAPRYTIPLSPPPAVIVRLACAVARYFLYDDKPTERVEAEYQAALVALEKMASGEIWLMGPDGLSGGPEYSAGNLQFDDSKEY
ncbi:MAG: DUF1320 domain-containing protein [Nitrospinota bacterium]|nr:DUF1320 domain-containing protein [Nitrospinota bacterium]